MKHPRLEQPLTSKSQAEERKKNLVRMNNNNTKSSDLKLLGSEDGSRRERRRARRNEHSQQYRLLDSHVNGLQGDLKDLTSDSDQAADVDQIEPEQRRKIY